MSKKKTMWGGGFEKPIDELAWRFSQSIASDATLWSEEFEVSIAHVEMLIKQCILSDEEGQTILRALKQLLLEFQTGKTKWSQDAEDIHSAIESILHERIGELAGKLHTGRSRNDLIATTTRRWLVRRCSAANAEIKEFQKTLLELAKKHKSAPMPGYTHTQPAQPITLGFHLLAYFWMLQRDGYRFENLAAVANVSPLGSAALAGTPFPISRTMVAAKLGFSGPTPNALDSVSDRDFIGDALHSCATLMQHLSRLCQEIVLWSGAEFGFMRLDDAYSTGSSIMPQKRNPDFAELIRGRCSKVIGHWVSHNAMMKGLPLGYNRDQQDDKPPLFDSIRICLDSLQICNGMISTASFDLKRMKEAASQKFSTSTALADALAMSGIPFRQAHEMTANLVNECIKRNWTFQDLTTENLKKVAPEMNPRLLSVLDPIASIQSRNSLGGPGQEAMKRQLDHATKLLKKDGFKTIQ